MTENLNITWQTLLAIAGGVLVLYNAGRAVIGSLGPLKRMRDDLDNHGKKLANDHLRLCRVEGDVEMILKCNLTILKHMRTGNDTGLMDKTIDDMHAYLTGRK